MFKLTNKKLAALFLIILAFGGLFFWVTTSQPKKTIPTPTPQFTQQTAENPDSFVYNGKDGVDALTLLKEKADIEQDASGLVSAINGRKADTDKHEYWAFYVNDQMAQVGPASYKTTNSDVLMWKIETY